MKTILVHNQPTTDAPHHVTSKSTDTETMVQIERERELTRLNAKLKNTPGIIKINTEQAPTSPYPTPT